MYTSPPMWRGFAHSISICAKDSRHVGLPGFGLANAASAADGRDDEVLSKPPPPRILATVAAVSSSRSAAVLPPLDVADDRCFAGDGAHGESRNTARTHTRSKSLNKRRRRARDARATAAAMLGGTSASTARFSSTSARPSAATRCPAAASTSKLCASDRVCGATAWRRRANASLCASMMSHWSAAVSGRGPMRRYAASVTARSSSSTERRGRLTGVSITVDAGALPAAPAALDTGATARVSPSLKRSRRAGASSRRAPSCAALRGWSAAKCSVPL
mmetsp:Transcript_25813/g.79642  ORF Transcript_25813/g.79642 Transcript_25813/m.79642 type:complete len:276 (-) Transcript_25813:476-1303(-)